MAVTELFQALGDPYRLEMVKRLSSGEKFTIKTVLDGLDITRQGGRKHLQILAESGLVTLETKGRDTQVRLNRSKLKEGGAFIADLERQWDSRLEALRKLVEEE